MMIPLTITVASTLPVIMFPALPLITLPLLMAWLLLTLVSLPLLVALLLLKEDSALTPTCVRILGRMRSSLLCLILLLCKS